MVNKSWDVFLALALLCAATNIFAFNLDTVNYVSHEGSPDSMFGFSIALHQESKISSVIVGAPQADTSSIQVGVRRGGAVYKCDINQDDQCKLIYFDKNGNQFNEKGEQVDTKSNQWFGATVASAGIDGPVVACAPRYVFHTLTPRKQERVEPVGTCYTARNNFREFTEYSPCRTMYWGYHRQGSCQAGFSAAISKNGDRLFVGAPGSWYWQGQVYSIHTGTEYPYKPPRYGQFGEGGQIYSSSIMNPSHKVYQTTEGNSAEDDSYMGYSSVSGDFNGDGVAGLAVGMPRGGGLLGKVLIFSWNMTNQQNITGEQIGSYFGYSLCVADVDGDKRDDLIIGAPMYTEPNNEGKYEMGRVYIMYHNKQFKELDTRDGVTSKARFGLALAGLGDINMDGYGDFAVGAPYDGPKGHGAVYVYHGSKTGPLPKHSQVIYAEDIPSRIPLTTFGFSVSGGIDLDGNLYPDMAVGAYESNRVIVFKSRPVAVLQASTIFESENKLISLDNQACETLRDRKKVPCTTVTSCLKYNGINLPQTIDIEISWVLDAKKPRQPRMFFINDETRNIRNSSMRLSRGKMECRSEKVYITENIRDKLTPLEVEMRYDLRSQTPPGVPVIRRSKRDLEPVLDHNLGLVQRDSINIQKNCGPDNECVPDIRLEVKTVDKFLLGSKDLLQVEVLISNFGEDAYESNFYMTIPAGLQFRRVDKIGDIKDTPITCTAPNKDNNLLKCELGNPFPGGKVAKFKVILNPSKKAGMTPSYDFYMEANSTNVERKEHAFDNIFRKSVGIWVETDLKIIGQSNPQEFHYNTSMYKSMENSTSEHDIGPQVNHIFDISNAGPSSIEEIEIYIMWPHETHDGDDLMYLLSSPRTRGNIKCEASSMVNRRGLKIDEKLESIDYLALKSGVETQSGDAVIARTQQGGATQVAVQSSSGHSSSSSSGSRTVTTFKSDEERKKLDAEENQESVGDASSVHRHRQQQAHLSGQRSGVNTASASGGGGKFQHSWSSEGPTVTRVQNRTTITGSDGRSRTYESSTEYSNIHSASFGGYGSSGGARGSYRQESRPGAGIYKIEDVQTETHIHPDLANANVRSSGGVTTERATTPSGRRRMMSQQDGEPPQSGLIQGVSQMEKMAQGGRGFQASTLDIGTLGRNNVDDELHQRGTYQSGGGSSSTHSAGSAGGSTGGSQRGVTHSVTFHHANEGNQQGAYQGGQQGGYQGNQQSSQSSYQYGSTGGNKHSSSSSSTTGGGTYGTSRFSGGGGGSTSTIHHGSSIHNLNDNDAEDDYSVDEYEEYPDDLDNTQIDPTHHQSQQHRPQHYTAAASSSTGYQQPGSHSSSFQHYRFRRDLSDDELDKELTCNATKCAIMRCVAGPLGNGEDMFIFLRTRLVAYTLDKNTLSVPLNISTKVVARVVKLPYIGEPQEKPLKTLEVPVKAIPEPIPKPDVVPLWVVVLSAVAGTIILLLLIYLLYKCGFFKRNRPTDRHSSERQPLNRNGNYHGDEHL